MEEKLIGLWNVLSIRDADDEFKEMWLTDARYIFQRVAEDAREGKDTKAMAYVRKLAKSYDFILVSEVFAIARLARGGE